MEGVDIESLVEEFKDFKEFTQAASEKIKTNIVIDNISNMPSELKEIFETSKVRD